MNRKGFTLIELLGVLVIISVIMLIGVSIIGNSLALNKEEAYKIMKNNVANAALTYVKECEGNLINCDNEYEWQNDSDGEVAIVRAYNLLNHGYFRGDSLLSPIDNIDVSNCMVVYVYRDSNMVLSSRVDDSDCN